MPSYAFRVQGIEPKHDPAWIVAGPDVHRLFWQQVVKLVLEIKDKELADGKDRFGEDLAEIAESTRKRGRWRSHTGMGSASAPPLDPAYRLSRTRSLFAGRAKVDHAEFFWRRDEVTGLPWGKVLGWHRAGAGRLPVRDVIGLSPASLAQVKARADAWWSHFKAGKLAEERAKTFVLVQPTATPAVAKAPAAPISFKFATLGIGDEGLIKQAAAEGKLSAPKKLGELPQKPKPPGGGTPAPAPKPVPKPVVPVPKPVVPKMAAMKPAPPPKPVVPKMAAPPKAAPPKPVVPKAKPKPPPPPVQVIPPPKPKGEPIPPRPPSYTARIAAANLAREKEEAARASAWTPRPQSDFREFTDTGSETEKWGKAAYQHWADTLPADELRALKIYAGDNYKWMNALLRGQPLVGDRALPYGMSEAGARDYVERAAAGLRAGKLPEDVVTYRGVSDRSAMGLADLSAIEQGREMTIESFGSATMKKRTALEFGTKYGGPDGWMVLQVNQPKGSTGAYINAAEISQYDDEREFLMPPGAKLRYVGPGKPIRFALGVGGVTPVEVPVAIFERIE